MSGQRMRATALQSMVDRGEAATLKEAQTVLSARGYAASLERLIESGEAVTLEEARKMQAASGRPTHADGDAVDTAVCTAYVPSLHTRQPSTLKDFNRRTHAIVKEALGIPTSCQWTVQRFCL